MTMIDVEHALPPPGVEVLAKMESGRFAVVSFHQEHPEQWWPGDAYSGEYGYEASVDQNVVAWRFLE